MIRDNIKSSLGSHRAAFLKLGWQFGATTQAYSKGLCPFHHDQKPSMVLYENTGLFKCLACGASGDIIIFAGFKFGLDPKVQFKHILKKLEHILGVTLNEI